LIGLVEQKVIDLVWATTVKKEVLVSSFDPEVLKRVKQLDPSMAVAFISETSPFGETRALCLELGVFSYHPHLAFLERDLVAALHTEGVYIFPWNVEKAEDINRAFSLGVDGLIAKDPAMVLDIYGSRG
jgi:glycerophosphoryl diester phosphodiesterase